MAEDGRGELGLQVPVLRDSVFGVGVRVAIQTHFACSNAGMTDHGLNHPGYFVCIVNRLTYLYINFAIKLAFIILFNRFLALVWPF